MSELLDAARKALPGLEWRERVYGSGDPCAEGYDANGILVERLWYAQSADELRAAWVARRDALNAALGEGWVPVGERLPETVWSVLVGYAGRSREGYWLQSDKEWRGRDGFLVVGVTHWMPLPAPPKTP